MKGDAKMTTMINLRTARKQKARDAARKAASERSAVGGENRGEAEVRRAESERAMRALDGHRRDESET